jgi:ABC-type amino acid transport substrate-binding protein
MATASGGAEGGRLRLCADPANLPFSGRDAAEPGFEVEIARAIAEAIGADFSADWVPTVRDAVVLGRLADGRCDLWMGLPITPAFTDGHTRLIFTAPYYVMRQVLVTPAANGGGGVADLGSRLVGVQAMTLSDQLAYQRGYNRRVYRTAADTLAALARGEVDRVVMESPLAGWFVKTNAGFRATAIDDPGRALPIGAAVRKTDGELKQAVDLAIRRLQATRIPEILARYGIALAEPAPAAAPLGPNLRAARTTYLTQCSQCHGTDATGTAAAANLRAFKGSEDDFVRTVRNGRPGTAMTPWKGLISDDDIRDIARYINQLSAGAGTP